MTWLGKLCFGVAPLMMLFLTQSASFCTRNKASQKSSVVEAMLEDFKLDHVSMAKDLNRLAAQEHPFGSVAQQQVATYITDQLQGAGLMVLAQDFKAATPHPLLLDEPQRPVPQTIEKSGRNLFVKAFAGQEPCVILLGSHYDTKILEQGAYMGANDSGSSTVALMHILKWLYAKRQDFSTSWRCGIAGYFFDGEEAVLPEWDDGLLRHPARIQDNTYGSRYAVAQLRGCAQGYCLPGSLGGSAVEALVLMDMIGMAEISLTRDSLSTPRLLELALAWDKRLHQSPLFGSRQRAVQDDHVPFLRRGVPAVNLIDFNNTATWHEVTDTVERVSFDSMERTAKLAVAVGLDLGY